MQRSRSPRTRRRFGSIAVTGFSVLRRAKLENHHDLVVVSVSRSLSLLAIANAIFFSGLGPDTALGSRDSITLAGVSAITRDRLFDMTGRPATAA